MNPIVLLPLGSADRATVAALCPALEEVFEAPVIMREAGVDLNRFFDERRLQYNSTAIIQHLCDHLTPASQLPHGSARAPRFLAVVEEDLFIPILTFVFGEAQLNGSVAVVSYHRLQNEKYGLPPNPDLMFERLYKEAIHELGHVFGLMHCTSQQCAMHISTYAEDIDMKPAAFCSPCRQIVAARNRS